MLLPVEYEPAINKSIIALTNCASVLINHIKLEMIGNNLVFYC